MCKTNGCSYIWQTQAGKKQCFKCFILCSLNIQIHPTDGRISLMNQADELPKFGWMYFKGETYTHTGKLFSKNGRV